MLRGMKVKPGPQVYRYDDEAFELIPEILQEFQAKNVLIVHGTISWEKAEPYLTFLSNDNYQFTYHQYSGECSYDGMEVIKQIVPINNIDFIIGVGGGKLADLVGVSAHFINVPFGVVPTIASNCAPWTPLSVMYKENGESEGKSEHYLRQAAFFITSPTLVIDSPERYFVAGMADTIAKWYESDAILAQAHLRDLPFLKVAQYTTEISKDIILEQGEQALSDMREGTVTEAFKNVSEIIFGVAGLVGGLGDKYARNAAAHAMHDGLGKYMSEESHHFIHGEIVAYGIFYQMALEQRFDEIDKLIPFYERMNLPKSLADMNITLEDNEVLDNVIAFIDSKEKVHLLPMEINKEVLKEAVFALENNFESIKSDYL